MRAGDSFNLLRLTNNHERKLLLIVYNVARLLSQNLENVDFHRNEYKCRGIYLHRLAELNRCTKILRIRIKNYVQLVRNG